MTAPPPDRRLVAKAAARRAAGQTWEKVADALLLPVDEVCDWPTDFPHLWRPAARAALADAVAEASAEAIHVLRRHIRSGDDRTEREAAGWLARLLMNANRHKGRPTTAGKPGPKWSREALTVATMYDQATPSQFENWFGCPRDQFDRPPDEDPGTDDDGPPGDGDGPGDNGPPSRPTGGGTVETPACHSESCHTPTGSYRPAGSIGTAAANSYRLGGVPPAAPSRSRFRWNRQG